MMGKANASSSSVNMGWGEQSTWFISFTFPMVIGTQSAEEKVKEWLRRLRQTLGLKEDEVFVSYLLAPQLRGVWHVHMEVKAPGLSELSQQRWEEKWTEITGRKVTEELRKYETVRVPAVIRRRCGQQDVVTYIRDPWSYVISEISHYTGGGTCKIRQVGQTYISSRRKQEYVCTVEGIQWYLGKRHSNEIKESHTFLGIS